MYDKIIIASALDQGFCDKAINAARALVSANGTVTIMHVIEPVNNVVQSFVSEDAKSKTYETIKEIMAQRCLDDDLNTESVILAGHAGSEIPKYAAKINADCIIVGSHKPGLEDFFLGSTSARIVRHAKCAVHVLR